MVEIKKIKQPVAFLYKEVEGEPGVCLGMVEDYAQFLDVRVQIKKQGEDGYYFVFKGEKVPVKKNGRIENYPVGFFGDIENGLLDKLIGLDEYENF